jgi:O-antigen/teichoic acid export membrane protein
MTNDEAGSRRLLARASLVAAGTLYQQGVAFASGLIVARVVGAADYGVFTLARSIVDVAGTVTRLGLDIGLQRFFGQTSAPPNAVSRSVILGRVRLLAITAALIAISAVGLWLGPYLEAHVYRYRDFADVLLCLAVALPFANDVAVLGGAYRGILKLTPSILVECVLQPTLRLAAIGALMLAGWRLWAAVVGTTFAACLAWFVLALASRRVFRDRVAGLCAAWADAFHVVRYSSVLGVSVLVTSLTSSVDVLLLGHYASAAEVGRYSLAKMLVLIMGVVGGAFVQGLGSTIAALHYRGEREGLRNAMAQTITWVARTTLPAFLVFVFWGAELMHVFGPTFETSSAVVRWLAVSQFVLVVFGPCGWALSMTGRHVLELGVLVLGLATAAAACWFAVPAFGQVGAAAAMAMSALATNALRVSVVARSLRALPFGMEIPWLMASSFGLAFIVSALVAPLHLAPLWSALLCSSTFLAGYAAVIWRFVLSDEERETVRGGVRRAQLRASGARA